MVELIKSKSVELIKSKSVEWIKSKSIEQYGLFFLTMSVIVQRLSVGVGSVLFVASILCLLFYLYKTKACGLKNLPRIYWQPFLLFAISLLPATFFSDRFWVSVRWFLNNTIYAPMAFWIIVILCKDYKLLKKSFLCFGVMFLVESIFSLVSYYSGMEARTSGFGGSILGYACCVCMLFSILLVSALDESFSKRLRLITAISIVIIAYALLTTGSRGGFGTFAVVAVCMAVKYLRQDKKKLVGVGVGCLLISSIILLNPGFQNRIWSTKDLQQASFYSRFVAYEAGFRMMMDHPIVGIGPKLWKAVYESKYYKKQPGTICVPHAHNNIVQMMAETGLPGLFGYVFLMYAFVMYNFGKLMKKFNPYRLMILGVILAFNCYGMIEYSFGLSIVVRTFWYLMGVLSVAADESDKRNFNVW